MTMNDTQRTKIRGKLINLLQRNLQTMPMPIPVETIYEACFPGYQQLSQMLLKGPDAEAPSRVMRNFLNVTDSTTCVVFDLNPPEVEESKTFWVSFNRLVCYNHPLYVIDPEVNRLLTDWHDKYNELENFIQRATYCLYTVTRDSKMLAEWPELVEAVPVSKLKLPKRRSAAMRKELDEMMEPELRTRVVDLIAAGTLLPEVEPSWGVEPVLK